MHRLIGRLILLCLVLSVGAVTAVAQTREPVWITVERARRMELERDFGRAIQLYLQVLELDRDNAEATLGLGRVFRDIADPDVARTYLDDALELRDQFLIPGNAVAVRYERATFFRDLLEYGNYEDELRAILSEDTTETDLPDRPARVLMADGIDATLVLYRSPENSATRARGMLAELLVGMGRYGEASNFALRAVIEEVSTIGDAVLRRDPFYQFSTVADALDRAAFYPETRAYVESTYLFHDLYYLGAAFLGEERQGSTGIWRLLADRPEAGSYQGLASRQLVSPRPEPLIVDVE